jgi:hypothetical protein
MDQIRVGRVKRQRPGEHPPDIVARDKLVFNLGERTGNIWMVRRESRP